MKEIISTIIVIGILYNTGVIISAYSTSKYTSFIRRLYWKIIKKLIIKNFDSQYPIIKYPLLIQLNLSPLYKEVYIKKGIKELINLIFKWIENMYLKPTINHKNNTIQGSINYMKSYHKNVPNKTIDFNSNY